MGGPQNYMGECFLGIVRRDGSINEFGIGFQAGVDAKEGH